MGIKLKLDTEAKSTRYVKMDSNTSEIFAKWYTYTVDYLSIIFKSICVTQSNQL